MLTSRGWKVSNSILKHSANKSHCIQSDLIAVSKEQITTAALAVFMLRVRLLRGCAGQAGVIHHGQVDRPVSDLPLRQWIDAPRFDSETMLHCRAT